MIKDSMTQSGAILAMDQEAETFREEEDPSEETRETRTPILFQQSHQHPLLNGPPTIVQSKLCAKAQCPTLRP